MNDFNALSPFGPRPLQSVDGPQTGTAAARQLPALAQEFESLLLAQMLQQLRQTMASLGDDGEVSSINSQLEGMNDAIDGELARFLSRAGGFGLSGFLQRALAARPDLSSAQVAAPASTPVGQPAAPAQAVAPPITNLQSTESPREEAHDNQFDAMSFAGSVTSGFGWRNDPITHTRRFHGGVDIRAAYGQEVPAAGAGRVVEADERGGYGLTVVVEHPSGLRTRYAHLSAIAVREGDQVAEGQAIGRAGQSGRATGPHLHVELTRDNQRLDPGPLLRSAEFKRLAVVAD